MIRANKGGVSGGAETVAIYQFASGGGDDLKDSAQALRAGAEHNYQVVYQESEYGIAPYDTAGTLREGRIPEHQMVYDARGNGSGDNVPNLTGDHANRITDYTPVVVQQDTRDEVRLVNGDGPTARHNNSISVMHNATVRRLTPTECERLMGMPDGWTEYGLNPDGTEYKQSDTPRYKQLGNAVVVPNVEFIARRLA